MKNIGVITGSRADYGIMKRLLKKINNDDEFNLRIIVTAMHLEEKYGYTYKDIENDGFNIFKKIPLNIENTKNSEIINEMSKLSLGLSEIFDEYKFDLIIILGDRYEMLAAASTAMIYRIPICHLHGGEKTLGNYDEFIRNSITKMSHLHLTSTEEYRRRVIQMGEAPDRVINTGSLGVENVTSSTFKTFIELKKSLNIPFSRKEYYVFLYHPTTLESIKSNIQIVRNLLKVIQDKNVVFIGSNSDTGSDIIMNLIHDDVSSNKHHILFKSLITSDYHSLVRNSSGIIGNSSSGLIEVPSLKVPTLNIGNRQKGRTRGNSVIDSSGLNPSELEHDFIKMKKIDSFFNPYEKNGSSTIAYNSIKSFLLDFNGIEKDFFDIKFQI